MAAKKNSMRGWWTVAVLLVVAAACGSPRDESTTSRGGDRGNGGDARVVGGSDQDQAKGGDGESEIGGGPTEHAAGATSAGGSGGADDWLQIDGTQGSIEGGAPAVDCEERAQQVGKITLSAIIRDFQFTHPDFERGTIFAEEGLVAPTLGADGKPVFAGTDSKTVTSAETFDQWYRDVPGVNIAIHKDFILDGDDVHLFNSTAYFPIDGQGFGNEGYDADGVEHNFAFTSEIHATFVYRGGERFTFSGDDDLWVFIADQLVIDLGGVHSSLTKTLDLDQASEELGLEIGGSYPMALFHAERQTTQSNFGIRTDLSFTCD